MKGTKEFNRMVFELFLLYHKRRNYLQNEFREQFDFDESPEDGLLRRRFRRRKAERGYKQIDLNSLNREIRLKEKLFFHNFSESGVFNGHPFVKLCKKAGLSRLEQKVIICLLGEVISEILVDEPYYQMRYEKQSLFNLVFPYPEVAFERMNYFNNENKLFKMGIVEKFGKSGLFGIDPSEFELNPEIAQWLICSSEKEPEICKSVKARKNDALELLEVENPGFGLNRVVLPENIKEEIERSIYFYRNPQYHKDEFSSSMLALFYGPPGTGKTFTARAIAGELKKPIARVQFARVRDMWYGNTEKILVFCFRKASSQNMVLLFDEADALISGRQTARTGVENVEHTIRNLFLQEVERFNGILILTTNMAECLDYALERRMNLKLEFALPELNEREKLWKKFLRKVSCEKDINFRELAEQFPLAGGHIKNVVSSAMRKLIYIQRDNPNAVITRDMLFECAYKECQFLEFKDKNKMLGFRN